MNRSLRTFSIALMACATCGSQTICAQQHDDFELMEQRLIYLLYHDAGDRYYPVSDERAAELAEENRETVRQALTRFNGRQFSDVDYESRSYQHTQRIFQISLEYARVDGLLYKDKALLAVINQALDHWFANTYLSSRWTDKVFRIPRNLFYSALLLGADLDRKYVPLIGEYATYDPMKEIGQNRIWVCSYQLNWAVFMKDVAMVDRLSHLIQGELKIQLRGEEGLQSDYSWLQHGPQFYSGGYGLAFVIETGRFGQVLADTPYAFSPATVEVLSNYVLRMQRWILWRNRLDYASTGRGFVEKERMGSKKHTLRSQFYRVVFPLMMAIDPANKAAYESALQEMDSKEGTPTALVGNRYYPSSDYMLQRGSNYFCSVRMHSTRTHGTEQGHSEGFKNYFLSDGAHFLYQSGHEYFNIFPVWNWRRVPGVTCADTDEAIPYIGWDERERRRGQTGFVGGVSDGLNGACSMMVDKDGMRAQKSWFFLQDGFLCLGAGIKGSWLSTSVSQCLLDGEVLLARNQQTTVIENSAKRIGPCSVYHDRIGYFFPDSQSVRVTAGEQSGYQESVSYDSLKGDWKSVDLSQCKLITKPVFSVGIEHKTKEQNGTYAYYVSPNLTPAEFTSLHQRLPLTILSNTRKVQAVKQDQMVQAVFYTPGRLMLSKTEYLAVDAPCIVMLRQSGDGFRAYVADPTQTFKSVNMKIGPGAKVVNVPLPQGQDAGNSVMVRFNNNGG